MRCANFINGELIGKPADATLPWAVQFPRELLDTEVGREEIGPMVSAALQRPLGDIVETIPRNAETNRVLAEFLTPRPAGSTRRGRDRAIAAAREAA